MAGFAIFSVLGFMSYEQGLPISEVAATGKSTVPCEITSVAHKICTQVISFYVLFLIYWVFSLAVLFKQA